MATQRALRLDQRPSAIKRGAAHPKTPAEAVELAKHAALDLNKEYAIAYRLYLVALADDAMRSDANQYNAACAALRFAAGDDLGEKPGEKQRSSLRKQAMEWPTVNLATARELAASAEPKDRRRAISLLEHWLRDEDLTSLRDAKSLQSRSPEERQRWEAFWKEVRDELAKAKR